MAKRMSNLQFRGMAFLFRLRDLMRPRENILQEVELERGFQVLDYGCGSGSYSVPAAKAVGETGRVYALDIHPLATEAVENRAGKEGLANVSTIVSDCATGLPDGGIDVVFLYDIFHMLDNREEVLREIHRVLRPEGILSFSDHHMKEEKIESGVTAGGLFALAEKGRYTYTFRPAG